MIHQILNKRRLAVLNAIKAFYNGLISEFKTRVANDGGTYESESSQHNILSDIGKPSIEVSKLLVTPNAYKAGKLYSIVPDDGSGDWNVARAGATATRVNENGLIEGVAANVPRLDYLNSKPVILVEGESENLALRSEEFDNSYWGKSLVSVTANDINAPDGNLTADKIIEGSSSGTHLITGATSFVNGQNYSLSVFAKADERGYIALSVAGVFLAGYNVITGNINVTGGIASVIVISAEVKELANSWFMCSVLFTWNLATTGSNTRVYIGNNPTATAATFPNYTGDGTSGLFLWGIQLELASKRTSYIPTVAATVTRPADVIDVNVPTGTNQIIVKMEDGSEVIENTPGATYQLPNGRIKSIQFL